MKIKENDNNLIVENYNDNNVLLNFLDIADNLEDHGVFIRIDNSLNVPILLYKKTKYLVNDCHIAQLETQNRIVFQKL